MHIERSCSAISGKEERFNGGRHMTLDFRWSNRIVRRILKHLSRKTMLDIILRRNRNIDTRLIELRIISSGITVSSKVRKSIGFMVFAFDLRLKEIGDFLFALGAHTLLVLCL